MKNFFSKKKNTNQNDNNLDGLNTPTNIDVSTRFKDNLDSPTQTSDTESDFNFGETKLNFSNDNTDFERHTEETLSSTSLETFDTSNISSKVKNNTDTPTNAGNFDFSNLNLGETLSKSTNDDSTNSMSIDQDTNTFNSKSKSKSRSSALDMDMLFNSGLNTQKSFGNKEETSSSDWLANIKVLPIALITLSLFGGSVFSYIKYEDKKDVQIQTVDHISNLEELFIKSQKDISTLKTSTQLSFDNLSKHKESISAILNVLGNGGVIDKKIAIAPLPSKSLEQLKIVSDNWNESLKSFNASLENKDNILKAKETINTLSRKTPELLKSSSSFFISLQSINPKLANDFNLSINRVVTEINTIALTTVVDKKQTEILVNDVKFINQTVTEIKKGHPELSDVIKNFELAFNQHSKLNEANVKALSSIADLKQLEDSLMTHIDNALQVSYELEKTFVGSEFAKGTGALDESLEFVAIGLLIAGLLSIAFIMAVFYARSEKIARLAEALRKNQTNETSVTELLAQIQPLDDGDFTRPIFVEDKFLSNISKRIDRTRLQFADIARTIKQSSNKVLLSADKTDKTSEELLKISATQFDKLQESINSIGEITNSMDEIAQTAWIAQDESARSYDESQKGEELVSQSIEKMNEIRITIQESSKKIKKLGESAQSITEVTGLIKDISKQINILALNAAIQAASSGESGREFTVVAQEVQRLADDSEEATKKIEELINDIQSDTATAIASMEKTTQEVVLGSQLTEKAGVALKEIHTLSKSTSEQIQSASTKLEEKSTDMAKLTIAMQDLQKISDASKQAINITTTEVEALKTISVELEDTVGRFKI